MVCISCIVVPVLLWLWHRFLQPIFLKIYNPWGKVENKTSGATDSGDQENKEDQSDAKCPISALEGETDKKTD